MDGWLLRVARAGSQALSTVEDRVVEDPDLGRVHKTVRCFCGRPAKVFLCGANRKKGEKKGAWDGQWAVSCVAGTAGCKFIMKEAAAVNMPTNEPAACFNAALADVNRAALSKKHKKHDDLKAHIKKAKKALESAAAISAAITKNAKRD